MSVGSPTEWTIEPLSQRHDRADFNCGESKLDDFLKKLARQNQDKSVNKSFVALRGGESKVLGYYTVSAHSLEAARFPPEMVRRLPKYPLPVVHLGRLAVDKSVQGQGLGKMLLFDALKKAVLASDFIGVFAMEVQAKTPKAKEFYERHLFIPIPEDPLHLVLALETVRPLVK
jgi:GNAT superfamily N-acetyltransferase